jgi:hypothetical protein
MTAGRPPGHVRPMDDPGRFGVAAWLAFSSLGLGPYQAAGAVAFLESGASTTESLPGPWLISTARPAYVTPKGRVDRIRRKAEEMMGRADDDERAWLEQSAGLISALVGFIPKLPGSHASVEAALEMLKGLGWADTVLSVSRNIAESLRANNYPPHHGELSRTARRLLRRAQEKYRQ